MVDTYFYLFFSKHFVNEAVEGSTYRRQPVTLTHTQHPHTFTIPPLPHTHHHTLTSEYGGSWVCEIKDLVPVGSHPHGPLSRSPPHLLRIALLTEQCTNKGPNACTSNHINGNSYRGGRCTLTFKFWKSETSLYITKNFHLKISNPLPLLSPAHWPASSKALMAPMCAIPLAPPPPNTSPTEVPVRRRARRAKSECLEKAKEMKSLKRDPSLCKNVFSNPLIMMSYRYN